MPPRQLSRHRVAQSALVLSLLAAWAMPATAAAAPRLRCQIEQGATSQVLEFAPVADPYSVPAIHINTGFHFKAVVIGDAQRVQYINLYTYYETDRRMLLLHEAKYQAPTIQTDPARDALTGRNYLYSPGRERQFQYGCALLEVNP
ncbi:hypothetical protein [uncultured Thiodictyon sp.]|uniref:hypothetical protein n=1 Tax=uncultured Thiodictyon sp. TaxID=1846217 RepID=UPI0025DAE2DD|nr:hypothetical protein [uncultured Thiodictyon sp.]